MTTITIRTIQVRADVQITEQRLSTEDTGAQLCQLIGCDLLEICLVDSIDLFADDEGTTQERPQNPQPI